MHTARPNVGLTRMRHATFLATEDHRSRSWSAGRRCVRNRCAAWP